MFEIADDMTIYITRGDVAFFPVTANNNGVPYKFKPGDVVRIKVYAKKDASNVAFQKDFPVLEESEKVDILLTEAETKIGDVISKPVDYWYEIELNPYTNPQTIIGYDDDGVKIFRLFPEGRDLGPDIVPEDIPVVDKELSLTSQRPVENQAVTRAIVKLSDDFKNEVGSHAEALEKVEAEVEEAINKTYAETDRVSHEIAVERARITNLAKLEEGSTTGDAELADARVGADGVTYGNLGEANRTQFANLKSDLSKLEADFASSYTEGAISYLSKRTYNNFNKFSYEEVNAVYPLSTVTNYTSSVNWTTIFFDMPVKTGELVQLYSKTVLSDYGVSNMLATLTEDTPTDNGSYVKRVDAGAFTDEYRGYTVADTESAKMALSFKFSNETNEEVRKDIIRQVVDNLCIVILQNATSPLYYEYPYIDYLIPDVQMESFDDGTKELLNRMVKHTGEVVVKTGPNRIESGTSVTLGSGWSGTIEDGFSHVSGSTEPIVINAKTYKDDLVLVTLTNSSVDFPEQLYVSIGEQTLVDTYFGMNTTTVLLKSDGGALKITPKSSYVGTITNISIKRLSNLGGEQTVLNLDTFCYGSENARLGFWNVLLGGENSFNDAVAVTRSVIIGSYAMDKIQYGSRHVAIGTYAMRALIKGERNIAIGADSMYRTTEGEDNVAIGMDSIGGVNTSVKRNVAVGNYSMTAANENAEENVSLGHYAGRYANKRNVYVGMRAGAFTDGNGNVGIGAYSMGGTSKHGGDNNTAIGANSQNDNTVVNRSTAIGYNACCNKSDQVVIGGDNVQETVVKGDLVVRGTDGVKRQIVFNADGSCSWIAIN